MSYSERSVSTAIGEDSSRYSQGGGDGTYESRRGLEATVRSLRQFHP